MPYVVTNGIGSSNIDASDRVFVFSSSLADFPDTKNDRASTTVADGVAAWVAFADGPTAAVGDGAPDGDTDPLADGVGDVGTAAAPAGPAALARDGPFLGVSAPRLGLRCVASRSGDTPTLLGFVADGD